MAKTTEDTDALEPAVLTGELQEIDWASMDYETALKLFEEDIVDADAETMGDGFVKLPTKEQLIGVPFLIVRGTFTPGIGKRGEKVTVRVITKDKRKFFFSDGSTGIYSQLRKLTANQTFGNVNCPKGLRASRFHWDEKTQQVTRDGEPNAATYYIDVS